MIDALVVYDVRTDTSEGERRLRAVAKLCEGIGTRVQYSVFELRCTPAQLITFTASVQEAIGAEDSVRIYRVPKGVLDQVEQLGRSKPRHIPASVVW